MAGKEIFGMSNPLQPECCPDSIPCSTASIALRTQSLDERALREQCKEGAHSSQYSQDGYCKRATSCHTISGNLALDPMITCKLCLCEYKLNDMHQMHTCACVYCKKCLQQYLVVLTDEGAVTVVTCPDAACRDEGKIEENEVKQLVDESMFKKYQKVKFMKEIEMDPHRAWCPRAGCDTVCNLVETEVPPPQGKTAKGKKHTISKGQRFICPKCGIKFCSVCKAAWHGHKACSKLARGASNGKSKGTSHLLDMLGIQKDDSDDATIKRCPFCHIPIERDAGCAQMMCKNCQHVFCWYCLANLDNDFLLRHYDKGPCKNKLGHSRATVIFHRAQIVCVFAGFGFLLLLASPFLLVVAPCILCCKSKWGSMCDDFDDIPDH